MYISRISRIFWESNFFKFTNTETSFLNKNINNPNDISQNSNFIESNTDFNNLDLNSFENQMIEGSYSQSQINNLISMVFEFKETLGKIKYDLIKNSNDLELKLKNFIKKNKYSSNLYTENLHQNFSYSKNPKLNMLMDTISFYEYPNINNSLDEIEMLINNLIEGLNFANFLYEFPQFKGFLFNLPKEIRYRIISFKFKDLIRRDRNITLKKIINFYFEFILREFDTKTAASKLDELFLICPKIFLEGQKDILLAEILLKTSTEKSTNDIARNNMVNKAISIMIENPENVKIEYALKMLGERSKILEIIKICVRKSIYLKNNLDKRKFLALKNEQKKEENKKEKKPLWFEFNYPNYNKFNAYKTDYLDGSETHDKSIRSDAFSKYSNENNELKGNKQFANEYSLGNPHNDKYNNFEGNYINEYRYKSETNQKYSTKKIQGQNDSELSAYDNFEEFYNFNERLEKEKENKFSTKNFFSKIFCWGKSHNNKYPSYKYNTNSKTKKPENLNTLTEIYLEKTPYEIDELEFKDDYQNDYLFMEYKKCIFIIIKFLDEIFFSIKNFENLGQEKKQNKITGDLEYDPNEKTFSDFVYSNMDILVKKHLAKNKQKKNLSILNLIKKNIFKIFVKNSLMENNQNINETKETNESNEFETYDIHEEFLGNIICDIIYNNLKELSLENLNTLQDCIIQEILSSFENKFLHIMVFDHLKSKGILNMVYKFKSPFIEDYLKKCDKEREIIQDKAVLAKDKEIERDLLSLESPSEEEELMDKSSLKTNINLINFYLSNSTETKNLVNAFNILCQLVFQENEIKYKEIHEEELVENIMTKKKPKKEITNLGNLIDIKRRIEVTKKAVYVLEKLLKSPENLDEMQNNFYLNYKKNLIRKLSILEIQYETRFFLLEILNGKRKYEPIVNDPNKENDFITMENIEDIVVNLNYTCFDCFNLYNYFAKTFKMHEIKILILFEQFKSQEYFIFKPSEIEDIYFDAIFDINEQSDKSYPLNLLEMV